MIQFNSDAAAFQDISAEENNQFLEAALRYAAMGPRVIPVQPGGKIPLLKDWQNRASNDPETIRQWWKKWPNANIGILTEGFLVADVDGQKNYWPFDKEKHESLANVPKQATPRGGCHYAFRVPPGKSYRNTASALADKVDTRANGGFIVAAPSIVKSEENPEGAAYEWFDKSNSLLTTPVADLPYPPDWLIEKLDSTAAGRDKKNLRNLPNYTTGWGGGPIADGTRNNTLASYAGKLRRDGMEYHEILDKLRDVNQSYCCPPMADERVQKVAASICRYPTGPGPVPHRNGSTPPPAKPAPGSYSFVTRNMKKPPQPIEWLVRGLLPLGRLVVLHGAAGMAKSTFVRHVCARLIDGRGSEALEIPAGQKTRALWVCTEDGDEDQITPNLMAEGVEYEDLERFEVVSELTSASGEVVSLGKVEALAEAVRCYLNRNQDTRLVVVDPLAEIFAQAGSDSNITEAARLICGGFRKLAAELNICVLLIAHDNKSQEQDGANKVAGSHQIIAACRWALQVKKAGDIREISFTKGNLAARDRRTFYARQHFLELDDVRKLHERAGLDPSIFHETNIDCFNYSEVTVQLGAPATAQQSNKKIECANLIHRLVTEAGGSMPRKDVEAECLASNISHSTFKHAVEHAKKFLAIKSSGANQQQILSVRQDQE